jgi:hypothetical protein
MQTAQFKSNTALESSLTYVPGLVGDIVEYIVANAHRPNRVFALGAAVTVVGTLISPRVVGPIGNPTHLYALIVGPTGIGKDCPRRAVAKLIEAVAGARVHCGDFASLAGLNRALAGQGRRDASPNVPSPAVAPIAAAVVIDEILGFLARVVNTRDRRLATKLCALWDSTWRSTSVQVPSDQASSGVCAPPFSLFGTASGGEFWPLLRGQGAKVIKRGVERGVERGSVDDNLFSRFLVFESDDGGRLAEQLPPISDTVPAALKDKLVELFGCGPDSNIEFEPRRLPWASPETEEVYRQLNDRIDREIDNDPSQGRYLGRVPEQAVRLATIRAAGIAGHRAKVDVADMIWGGDLASILATNTMERARERPPVRTARGEFVEHSDTRH